jgi:hypothetical protein
MGASIDSGNVPVIARRQCSRLLFELYLIAQGDAVGAHRRDLRLQAGPAAINSTAVHGHQAEAAALVETQRINVVVCRNDPQPCAPLLPGQLPDRLDQRCARTTPLLIGVQSEDLALPPVERRHVGEHAQQVPVGGLGDKGRMIQGMNQFPQPGPPQTVVPGKKRLGSSLVGGLPRSDLHRLNITATEKGTIVLPARTFGVGDGPSALPQRLLRVKGITITSPDGTSGAAEGPDLVRALRALRRVLDRLGVRLGVNGARRDARGIGDSVRYRQGRVVYHLAGAGRPEQVSTLGDTPVSHVGTVDDQDQQYERWLHSRRTPV